MPRHCWAWFGERGWSFADDDFMSNHVVLWLCLQAVSIWIGWFLCDRCFPAGQKGAARGLRCDDFKDVADWAVGGLTSLCEWYDLIFYRCICLVSWSCMELRDCSMYIAVHAWFGSCSASSLSGACLLCSCCHAVRWQYHFVLMCSVIVPLCYHVVLSNFPMFHCDKIFLFVHLLWACVLRGKKGGEGRGARLSFSDSSAMASVLILHLLAFLRKFACVLVWMCGADRLDTVV